MFLRDIKMRIKLLMGLLISLSVFSTNYVAAANTTKKNKISQKSSKSKKKAKSSKKAAALPTKAGEIEEKITNIEYKCDDNQKFNLLGKLESDNNITVGFAGTKVILTRVTTDTGANRFTNEDKGFDLVNMPNKSMLMNTKSGRRLADNCQSPVSTNEITQATEKNTNTETK
jgi:hypothetical protein